MNTLEETPNGFWHTLLRRRRIEVAKYHAGDVHVTRPLYIAAEGILAGDIVAPQVNVDGLVYGGILARNLVIHEGGQVWGDIYAVTVEVEEGGRAHGWFHSLSQKEFKALEANGLAVDDLPLPEDLPLPGDLLPGKLGTTPYENGSQQRAALLRLLQTETGAALVARMELEQAFENRVAEEAADALQQAQTLQARLEVEQTESEKRQGEVEQAQATIVSYEVRLEEQARELAQVQEHLQWRRVKLEQIESRLEEKVGLLAEADAMNEQLQERLNEAMNRADSLTGRVESLESALQSSVQHTAEQEEALLRWQELAEVTQERVDELETRTSALNSQLEENQQINDLLRDQRQRAEQVWEEAVEELELLRQELARRPETPETDQEVLAEAREQIGELEADLLVTREELEDVRDQLLWYRMSLKTTTAHLRSVQDQEGERQQLLENAQAEAVEQEQLAEQWKRNVGRLSELLYEAEQRLKLRDQGEHALQVGRADFREVTQRTLAAPRETQEQLQQKMREQAAHIEALEAEAEHYHTELDSQSRRLAEIRVVLAEQEIARQQMKGQLEKRTAEIEKVKQLASQRIRSLEGELADSRRKLQDLVAFVERRHRGE